jgi:predicted MPP superfamily phosphohydrolase
MIKKILHFLVRLLLILLLMALVLGSILLYNLQMNKSFITTFYTVTVDKPVEDLRIVLLSDLHLSEYGTDNADLVQKVRNLAPDLIAVAGDMDIDTNPDYSLVLSLMRQLVDIAPVYYAPGNHEWAARYANGCDTIFDDIEATGVHWMNGTYEDAVINGKKLRIGGFFEWPRAQLDGPKGLGEVWAALRVLTGPLPYLVCPEVLDTSLADEKFDLVLSGHAHGGQVRIGGHGLWSTSQGFLPKYTSGVNQMGESQVVISRGLGDSEPYPRIFNQPELVVVDVN